MLDESGQALLSCAIAYGFRNIQNLVQKIKRGRSPYHFVEVMACPSGMCRPVRVHGCAACAHLWRVPGCLNGGGQIKGNKDLLARVTDEYESLPPPDEGTQTRVEAMYRYALPVHVLGAQTVF